MGGVIAAFGLCLIAWAGFAESGSDSPNSLPPDSGATAAPIAIRADADWKEVWGTLEKLEALHRTAAGERGSDLEGKASLEPTVSAIRALTDELNAIAQSARVDTPRDAACRALLRAELRALRGQDPALEVPAVDPWPYDPRESWLAAELLAPGEPRARAVVAGLDMQEELSSEQLNLAWSVGVEEAGALRLGNALQVQRKLHTRVGADWSAINLALTLMRAGAFGEAERTLAEQLARGGDRAALWHNRGLVALGAGDERRARDAFGHALGLGSDDAALVLANMELAAGRLAEARAGFRPLVARPSPSAWSLRGWGITLIEPPAAAPDAGGANGTTGAAKGR